MAEKITKYPLTWPLNWKRTPRSDRARANFHTTSERASYTDANRMVRDKTKMTVASATERIEFALRKLYVPFESIVISTNIKVSKTTGAPYSSRSEPDDPGAAVYWQRKGKPQALALDRYDRTADNLAAIAATLEALRAIDRHGGGMILDRAFTGFAQLPASIVTQRPWREVFQMSEITVVTEEELTSLYRGRARMYQAQVDAIWCSTDKFVELDAAYKAGLEEIRWKK